MSKAHERDLVTNENVYSKHFNALNSTDNRLVAGRLKQLAACELDRKKDFPKGVFDLKGHNLNVLIRVSEVMRDMDKGSTYLSQTHYAEDILRIYNFWNATPRLPPMQPNTRLNKGDCDKNPASDFHWRYCGIVGSLGYLVTMTHPDLAWIYSELSKYVQFPGKNHMLPLNTFCLTFTVLGIKRFATLATLTKTLMFCGVGWMQIGLEILTPNDLTRDHSHDEWRPHLWEESAPR